MTYSVTYAQLSSDIQNWLEDSGIELVDEAIPRIIALAELRILKDMQLASFDDIVVGQVSSGLRHVDKPTENIVQTIGLFIVVAEKRQQLLYRSLGYVEDYDVYGDDAVPIYFTDKDSHLWIVTPAPDDNYNYEAHVIIRPEGLDESIPNGTTWLSTRFPELLMYSCMVEAAAYIVDDERIPTWKASYQEAVTAAIIELQYYRRINGMAPLSVRAEG